MTVPQLGVGLVYWPRLAPLLESVDLIEVEPQSYWHKAESGEYRVDVDALEMLASLPVPRILHGVGFPVGGTEPPDPAHLPPLLAVRHALDAAWASEHLSFNRFEGRNGTCNTGFFLPPLQSGAGVEFAVSNIGMMKEHLGIPYAFETAVNYLKPRRGEMSDGAFVAEIAERADCGILLDLHNIWANERNGRQPVREFLSEIPLDRVWEIHLAGGFERDGFWLDAHSGEIPAPVLEIARDVIPQLPNLGAIIFEMLPFFIPYAGIDLVSRQIEIMRNLWLQRTVRLPDSRHSTRERKIPDADISPGEWECALGGLARGEEPGGVTAEELRRDQGVKLLKTLAEEFRAGMIADAMKLTSRLLLLHLGEEGFREILSGFWKISSPELFESAEASAFASHLQGLSLPIPHLDEVAGFELAAIRALTERRNQMADFSHDPIAILDALREGRIPDPGEPGCYEVEVTFPASR